MMKLWFSLILAISLLMPLWADSKAREKFVMLLKDQERWDYFATPAEVLPLLSQQSSESKSLSVNGFEVSTFDKAFLGQTECFTTENKELVIVCNDWRLTFGFMGASSNAREKDLLNFDYLKEVFVRKHSEETFSELNSDEVRELLPSLMLKTNLLDGFSDFFIFEGDYAQGYACYRSSDRHIYGQIWVSGAVFVYSISEYAGNEWKNFTIDCLSKFKRLEVGTFEAHGIE